MADQLCINCIHCNKSVSEEPCISCKEVKCSENTVGIVLSHFEPIGHSCSTCKHYDKKITEEPCLYCDIRARNDKWEARDVCQ